MGLTLKQANRRLLKVTTKEQLLRLVQQLDVSSSGNVTVLYSGVVARVNKSTSMYSHDVVNAMLGSGEKIRVIDNTDAAKFLNIAADSSSRNTPMYEALRRIFGDDPNDNGSQSYRFLYGDTDGQIRTPNGAWDRVSARFVDATKGAVVTITGGADPNRVFAQTELPRILQSGQITTVDGIPHQVLKQLSPQEAFLAVRAQSEVRSSELRIAVDASGRPIDYNGTYRLDTRTFFADTPGVEGKALPVDTPTRALGEFVPPERMVSHEYGVKQLQRVQESITQSIAEVADTSTNPVHLETSAKSALLSSLDHVGSAIDVLTLAMASLEAKTAYDQGDAEKARTILMDWVLENGGALAAGRLAAMATAPLLAAGPLGVLLAAGITIGASVAGGIYGDDLARQIYKHLVDWTDDQIDGLKELFALAEITSSPIILDLDGNGVSSLRQSTSGIYFDHEGNGFAERTGWVAPDDVLLVHDLDRNGRIETGAELFGNHTLLPNGMKAFGGFEALRQFDSNQDGKITALDSSWQELQAWRDGNSNAKVDEGELLSLDTAGIAVLNLSYVNGFQEDEQGNKHSQLGSFQSVDGLSHAMNDVWFSVDLARTEQRELMPVPEALQQLPDLPGFGNVASLHQAMAAEPSGQLPGLIRQWMVASSADRTQLMESIIVHWTGVQDYQLVYPLWEELTERRRLAALENFIGRTFRDGWPDPVPGFRAYVPIEQAFDNLSNLLEDQLIAQVDALPLLRAVSGSTTTTEGTNSSAFEPVVEILRNQLDGNPDVARLVKTGRVLERLGADGLALLESMANRSKSESGMFGLQLQAFSSIDACSLGTDQEDPIIGSSLHEWIEGRSGNDSLAGGDGNDILIGGAGDDLLAGDRGNDVYVFSSGDGVDTLFENDSTPANFDEVRFTNIASTDVREVERDFNNLLMHYGITDQLTLQNHFAGEAYRIEQFRFQDGVLWGQAELEQRLLPALAAAVA